MLLNPFYTTLHTRFPFRDQDGLSGSSRKPVTNLQRLLLLWMSSILPHGLLFCSPSLVLSPMLKDGVFLMWTQAIPGKCSYLSSLSPTPGLGFALGAWGVLINNFPRAYRNGETE